MLNPKKTSSRGLDNSDAQQCRPIMPVSEHASIGIFIMNNGWIKIHRRLLEWQWFTDSKMVHLFIYFLLSANHADGIWRNIEVKRGQYITGLKSLGLKTGIKTQSLRTCLNRLKSTGEITIKSTNKYSIITVCKYDSYQEKSEPTNKQDNKQTNKRVTNNQQTTNKQLTTNKNKENKKNDNNIKNREQKFINECLSINKENNFILIQSNVTLFTDYWTEKNKSGNKMKFELQQTWDIKRRLQKWSNNNDKWNKFEKVDLEISNDPNKFDEDLKTRL